MARKEHHEEHENHERWVVSYADFMTLLFALFVVLYAVGAVDQKRVTAAEKSVRFAMHFKGTGGTNTMPIFNTAPAGGAGVMDGAATQVPMAPPNVQAVEALRRRLQNGLKPLLQRRPEKDDHVTVELQGRKLLIRLSAAHFFDAGEAVLRPDALPVIDAIMAELAPLKKPICVEGHTDDRPLPSTGRFQNNWELSAVRASSVVSYIERTRGLPPELLSVAGYGAARPLFSNASVTGRDMNRRIEIAVQYQDSAVLERF